MKRYSMFYACVTTPIDAKRKKILQRIKLTRPGHLIWHLAIGRGCCRLSMFAGAGAVLTPKILRKVLRRGLVAPSHFGRRRWLWECEWLIFATENPDLSLDFEIELILSERSKHWLHRIAKFKHYRNTNDIHAGDQVYISRIVGITRSLLSKGPVGEASGTKQRDETQLRGRKATIVGWSL